MKSCRMLISLFFLAITVAHVKSEDSWFVVGNPLVAVYPCNGTEDISISYEPGLPPGEENKYLVYIRKTVPTGTNVEFKLDSEASVTLVGVTATGSRISSDRDGFLIRFFQSVDFITFVVKGPERGTVPYIKSLKINTQEYCMEPKVGFLDKYIVGYQNTAEIRLTAPEGCGRRKVQHTELIVNGEPTKPGDWPWHVAIYKLNKAVIQYICGGTIVSKTAVLTAAHCTTIRGVPVIPEILSVVLGKYNLIGGDLETQEREVHTIIVHEDFSLKKHLNNDISLLILKSEATFNDYVQPACVWNGYAHERLSSRDVIGTVVGWGIDQTDNLSSQLKRTSLPIVSDATCIKKNALFYANVLTNNMKFCAGWENGTSACNGDSGGGYVVFVPDDAQDHSPNPAGSWYIRGIVSLSASRKDVPLCDPNQYTVFTDVEKYTTWIQNHLKNATP